MRTILRAFIVIVLFVAVAFLAIGYWTGSRASTGRAAAPAAESVGTAGAVDTQKARERGAEIGEKAAVAAKKVGDSMEDVALTTKIKAKMALDDTIKARAIDVTTDGNVVTLSGHVRSQAERDRAIALARETSGVMKVVDHLQVS
jgi:osmotically-inducible protein OsmY